MCSKEALWLSKLTVDVGGIPGAAVLYMDNTRTLVNIKGNPVSPPTKHIGVRDHRVRAEVELGAIDAKYVSTFENPADVFTKNLPKAFFQKFKKVIGIE